MTRLMLRYLFGSIPYLLLITCGLVALSMCVLFAADSFEAAARNTPIAEIESGDPLQATWVSVSDGYLCWDEATPVALPNGLKERVQACWVPYASTSLLHEWKQVPDAEGEQTVLLLRLDRESLSEHFPEVLAGSLPEAPQPFQFTGVLQDASGALAMGTHGEVRDELLEYGFDRVLVSREGSEPFSQSDAGWTLAGTTLGLVGSLIWVRRQRRRVREAPPVSFRPRRRSRGVLSGVLNLLLGVASAGMQQGVEQALRRTLSRDPGDQS